MWVLGPLGVVGYAPSSSSTAVATPRLDTVRVGRDFTGFLRNDMWRLYRPNDEYQISMWFYWKNTSGIILDSTESNCTDGFRHAGLSLQRLEALEASKLLLVPYYK